MQSSGFNLGFLRLLFFLFFVAIYCIRIPMLYFYTGVFYVSFEFLNHNARFAAMKFSRFYNIFIVFFVSYILLVRSPIMAFSKEAIYHLNTTEHLLFALIICMHLAIYLQIFNLKFERDLPQLLLITVAFNGIGLINEYFQNGFNGRPLLVLQPDSLKDLAVNLAGTFLFAALVLLHPRTRYALLAREDTLRGK